MSNQAKNEMHITLYLMSVRGLRVLERIAEAPIDGLHFSVVVGRDKKVLEDHADDIVALCKRASFPCYERKDAPPVEGVALAIAWRWLIHTEQAVIVLHDSLLPDLRGFCPVVTSLILGRPHLGATAFLASDAYDEGDILGQKKVEISYPKKIADAFDDVANIYAELVHEVLSDYARSGVLEGRAQNESLATYSVWRDDLDYEIDWSLPAEKILRIINALGYPYPGARTWRDGTHPIRILDAECAGDPVIEERQVGKLFKLDEGKPVIVCGQGVLKINEAVKESDRSSALPFPAFRVRLSTPC